MPNHDRTADGQITISAVLTLTERVPADTAETATGEIQIDDPAATGALDPVLAATPAYALGLTAALRLDVPIDMAATPAYALSMTADLQIDAGPTVVFVYSFDSGDVIPIPGTRTPAVWFDLE